MADLNFDPLFDNTKSKRNNVGRKVEITPESHEHSAFEQKRHIMREAKNSLFGLLTKLAVVAGVVVCVIIVIALCAFGWKAGGF